MGTKKEKLKELITKLDEGYDPDKAKEDFKGIISDTGPDELAKAEEELVKDGMPREKLNKLCDVHLAVFKEQLGQAKVIVPLGHPVNILMEEHRMVLEFVEKLNKVATKAAAKKDFSKIDEEMKVIKDIAHHFKEAIKHYLREENVLFPYIEKHGLTEPPAQMWIDHDKIRALEKNLYDVIEAVDKKSIKFPVFKEALLKTVGSLANLLGTHFFKENNILFPASLRLLTEDEWVTVRKEFDEIGYCCFTPEDSQQPFGVKADEVKPKEDQKAGVIEFETGPVPIEFIEPIMNSIPVDMTFVDENDKVIFFSKGEERIFLRTKAVIGRDVHLCHPEKSIHVVKKILDDFRKKKRDVAEFWINLKGLMIYIRYFAVRSKEGKYLGCLEVSQDITKIQKLEGQKRLLD
ncbi:MAG: DUF438 domain-containing protein [Candidatus Heimdallarchaeota archaeon]